MIGSPQVSPSTSNGVEAANHAPDVTPVAGVSARPLPNAPPQWLLRTVQGMRTWLLRCADALWPAEMLLAERIRGIAYGQMLGGVAQLGIADQLEAGPLSARELAQRTGCDEDALHRTLRSLASLDIFAMDAQGRFSNNRLSRPLCSASPSRMRAFIEYFASPSNTAAWSDFRATLATGQSAFSRVHGMSVWRWFETHPEEQETFAQMMMGITLAMAPMIASLYPFHELKRLCDVGGGRGTLLSELLVRNPSLRGVLYDSSGVLASARGLLEQRGVADRVECVAGSFFDGVPEGCDAYLLKTVLHDWDDATCTKILSNVRRVMPPDGRLLLAEFILERNVLDANAAPIDVHMLVACEQGRERSRGDFEALLAASGFRLDRVFHSPASALLEAHPV